MKKTVSRFAAILLVLTMFLGIQLSSFAMVAAFDKDYYDWIYSDYKSYYTTVYVPAYNDYNASLSALAAEVENATTSEQIVNIRNFVSNLKDSKKDFFGDRTTAGKSRFDVPFYRDSMTAAARDGDYDTACNYCYDLLWAVEQRVDFLNGLSSEIDSFTLNGFNI